MCFSRSKALRAFPRAPQACGFLVSKPRAAPCLVPLLREPAHSAFGFAFVSLRAPDIAAQCTGQVRETGASGGQRPGRACFPSLLRQPPLASASATASVLRSAAGFASPGGLASLLGEPACFACGSVFVSPRTSAALRSASVAPQALPAPFRFASGLASRASEPPAVSPRGPRSRYASPREAANPLRGFAFNVFSSG